MRSILIVRPGALGDAVLTLPLLQAILAADVERITILGTPASWGFLTPGRSPIELLDFGAREWSGLVGGGAALPPDAHRRLGAADAAIVLLSSRREHVEAALKGIGIARVTGATPAVPTSSHFHPARDLARGAPQPIWATWPPASTHAAVQLMVPLAALGIQAPDDLWSKASPARDRRPLLRPTSEEIDRLMRGLGIGKQSRTNLLMLHPGSGGVAKRWPAARFAALAEAVRERLNLQPVFAVGPADGETWAALRRALAPDAAPLALIDRPLREVAALLAAARVYVGNDSGISHLAARLCPSLALFGPSDAQTWHPLGERVAYLQAPNARLDDLALEPVLATLAALLER